MKKTMLAALLLGATLCAGQAMAAARWDGADDLPTNPLPCNGGAGTIAAKAYNGGTPTNPPDKAGKPITLVDIPKLIGIGYFDATSKGMQQAAKELGNVKVTTDGPTAAQIDQQITFIDNYITRGVDGILFAANDPVAIAPVLKKALGKGIHVVGYDADAQPDAREWFVNQAQFNGIGKAMIDAMAKEIGEDGSFAIVTSTFTTPNQARWIAEMQAYMNECHPKMKWLETVEAQEDNNLSFNQASALINKYGDKLKGLFGMTSVATPASAEAVKQANLCGKVAVVGLATPNAMQPVRGQRMREVGGAVEPGRSGLCRGLCDARGGGRQAEAWLDRSGCRPSRQVEGGQRQRDPAGRAVRVQQGEYRQVQLLSADGLPPRGAAGVRARAIRKSRVAVSSHSPMART